MPLSLRPLVFVALFALLDACTCGKAPTKETLRNETEVCTKDDECVTGLCDAPNGQQPVCVRKCSEGCRADEVCTQLTPGRFACQQDPHGLCRPCRVDGDCPYPSDKCIVVDGQGVCGRDCAFDMTCPTSYRCVNGVGTDGKARSAQCSPVSGSCACTAASAGMTIGCESRNTLGKCTGVRTCDGVMGYGDCSAHAPAIEACNGIDDDCDGVTDEDQPMVTCGVGACEVRLPSCGDGGVVACVPKDAGVETCNNLDDDCDGVVDNGFDVTTDVQNCGVCGHMCSLPHANAGCDVRACIVASCHTGYGNCDGIHSNGCETNTTTDVNNCGACGRQCQAAGADSSCSNGMCAFACKPGFIDLDGNPANGCEYACTVTSSTDLPDVDFIDANCDGMDGEVNNGVFVSPTGDDSAAGTASAPVQTLSAGIKAAVNQGKRDVYVSAGLFTGPLAVSGVNGVNIAGGYAPGAPRWTRSVINTTVLSGGNPALLVADAGSTMFQFITVRGDAAQGREVNGSGRSAYGAMVVSSSGVKLELMNIAAGAGAAGVDGVRGTDGVGGFDGGVGNNGAQNDNFVLCATSSQPLVGLGGASLCGRAGGAGGSSGLAYTGAGSIGGTGSAGVGMTPGGLGGPPHRDQTATYDVPLLNQVGGSGANGSSGPTGTAAPQFGPMARSGYVALAGGAGGDGVHGNGGGGGGGGGGGCQDLVVGGVLQFCYCYSYGSSGGGGGGGGCAGTGGTGGGSGGASIALFLYDAQVTQKRTTLVSGRGGSGGRGGVGGSGSGGGKGAASAHVWTSQGYSGIGGAGGPGGSGGAGGHGAGGTGGHSFGVLRNAGSVLNTVGLGFSAGSGGTGGTSSGTPGQDGVVVMDQTL